jgi:glycosyltransferase involved in cell wall biosynthesis
MTVAVCICTLARPASLKQCLQAIARAEIRSLAQRVFILVVDNGPDARTESACHDAAIAGLPELHYVVEPERGISFARNRALHEAAARGADFVAFVDDDDIPERDWLTELLATQRATGAEIIYGRWILPEEVQIPKLLEEVGFLRPKQFESLNRYGVPRGAATCNVLLARSLIERMAAEGPVFAPAFARCGGGDTEFFVRAHGKGASHAIANGSRVIRGWGPERLTVRGVLKRSFRLGHSLTLIRRLHVCERRSRLRKNTVRLATLLLTLPAYSWPPSRLVRRLAQIAGKAGAINAWLGRHYTYYGATDPRPPNRTSAASRRSPRPQGLEDTSRKF